MSTFYKQTTNYLQPKIYLQLAQSEFNDYNKGKALNREQ